MELIYHPEVRPEVREAARFYEERREGLGRAFLETVRESVDRVRAQPLTWPRVGKRVRRFVLPTFRHHIIYCVLDSKVVILAVAHDRRRPGYWRKRLRDV